MSAIQLDTTYEGFYQLLDTQEDGTAAFASWQSAEETAKTDAGEPALEFNSVEWSVDPSGRLTGTANFLTANCHDLIDASLEGTSPEPPADQDYREAFVTVTFNGGTRAYANATGKGEVEARLYKDGRSRGTIRGAVEIPDAATAPSY